MDEEEYISGKITAVFPKSNGVKIIVKSYDETGQERAILFPDKEITRFERGRDISVSCKRSGSENYYISRGRS